MFDIEEELKKLPEKPGVYLMHDKDDNIIESSGSEYIENFVKDKQFNKGKMLVSYIESHFKDNGGEC